MAYSWITPKTNWQSGDFCTYVDVNRIRNNILYLYEVIGVTPLHPTMLPNLTVSNWLTYIDYNWIQEEVYRLYSLIGCENEYPFIYNKTINSSPWSSTELNIIESLLLECKQKVEPGFYIYAGTELYADDNLLI